MEKISKGIVFSEDIKRILNGVNAFKFKYSFKPSDSVISEEDMMRVNNLIGGRYPHRNFG